MRSVVSTLALVAMLSFAGVTHAAGSKPAPTPTPGGPGDEPGPSQQPDYNDDPVAGVSGANSTGSGGAAIPGAPAGATGYATPGFGTLGGIGGAAQGGFPGQSSAVASFGQVFNSPGGTLNQISFTDTNSATGGTELRIAVFNQAAFVGDSIFATPGSVVGPTLYSASTSLLTNVGDKGGVNGNDALFYHTFANINLNLVDGLSYYAYLVPTANSQVFNGSNSGYQSRAYFFELATNGSSLGGEYVFQNVNGDYARVANQAANTAPYLQALYNIAITPNASAVPEPASWGLMIAGLGAVGFAMRRRVRVSQVRFDARIKRIAAGEVA